MYFGLICRGFVHCLILVTRGSNFWVLKASETFARHRGVCDQHVGAAHMYWSTSGVVYNASIMAEGRKSNLTGISKPKAQKHGCALRSIQYIQTLITVRCSVVAPACTTLLALLRAGVYFLVLDYTIVILE